MPVVSPSSRQSLALALALALYEVAAYAIEEESSLVKLVSSTALCEALLTSPISQPLLEPRLV